MVLFLKIPVPNKYWDRKCDFHDKYLTRDGQENDLVWPRLKFSTRQNSMELEQLGHLNIFTIQSSLSPPSGEKWPHLNTDCLNSLVQKRADFEYFQNLSCLFKRFEKWTDTGNKFNFRRSRKTWIRPYFGFVFVNRTCFGRFSVLVYVHRTGCSICISKQCTVICSV